MKVFVTGATGFIGTAVVRELQNNGHQVIGLARSDKAAKLIENLGAYVHRGSLEDQESLYKGAVSADGVIHLAFNNNSFDNFDKVILTDQLAIETIGKALIGSGKPFISTSVTTMLESNGNPATEDTKAVEGTPGFPRSKAENLVISLAQQGVRSAIIRLAPCVHDNSNQGFVTALSHLANEKGMSAYVNEGSNHWPAIHRNDAATLFRLALESTPAGAILHGVNEEGILFYNIAKAVGRKLNLPIRSISNENIVSHFGWLANFVTFDNLVSSKKTQALLNWKPKGDSLISDIENF